MGINANIRYWREGFALVQVEARGMFHYSLAVEAEDMTFNTNISGISGSKLSM